MNPKFHRRVIMGAMTVLPLFIGGCLQDKVAGGSSEVDNPIVVAFVDSAGASVATTGSLSIYLASQNPAVDPDPLLTVQIENASSVKLSSNNFTQTHLDSTLSYNLLLIGTNDSVGALFQNLSYQPGKGHFSFDSTVVSRVKVPLVPLVRYEASLNASGDTGLVRVFIPGTPFQSVVVESTFVLSGVPKGVYALHVLERDGTERPLKPAVSGQTSGNYHEIDNTVAPITRPTPTPPAETIFSFAGFDASFPASLTGNTEYSLFGMIFGVDPADKRLAVQWRQILPGPQGAKAIIDAPTHLITHVTFPRPGAYQFVLSAVLVNQRVEDTVWIGLQAPSEKTVFIEPTLDDTISLGRSYDIFWDGKQEQMLSLQLSRDGGATWQSLTTGFYSHVGLNKFTWIPPSSSDTSSQCILRLQDWTNTDIAVSQKFILVALKGYSVSDYPQGSWFDQPTWDNERN